MRNLGDVGDDTDMELVMMIKMGKTVKIIMLMIIIGPVVGGSCRMILASTLLTMVRRLMWVLTSLPSLHTRCRS